MKRVTLVAGARPNFVKIASLLPALESSGAARVRLVHTGQHFDRAMSGSFFDDLGIRDPDVHLGIGPGTHAEQTGRIMIAFERVLGDDPPDLVMVVGDVNSTLSCALVAAKIGIPVAHIEAGLRSFDRSMPEEINRVLTDAVSDLCFTTERSGGENLRREGKPAPAIHFVGNVMIDTLVQNRPRALRPRVLDEIGVADGGYAVLTLHRAGNVDRREEAERFLEALDAVVGRGIAVIFPEHPRTTKMLEVHGLARHLRAMRTVTITKPLPYLEFLYLEEHALAVVTDSGGIQEETTYLGVPCLTLRANTERPVTVERGTNRVVGLDPDAIRRAMRDIVDGAWPHGEIPELWDGKAAGRIAQIIAGTIP